MGVSDAVFKVCDYTLSLQAQESPGFVDITEQVENFVKTSQIQRGLVVIYSKHTTAAIGINENEPLLLKDMSNFLKNLAPRDDYYYHNDFTIREANLDDGELPNGHAHCQQLLVGSSESIPITNGKLQSGKWQRIFMIELDRPRTREIVVQILGI